MHYTYGVLAAVTSERTGWYVVLLTWWMLIPALGWRLGENYGGNLRWLGLFLGLLFGPIGLLILVVVGGQTVRAKETVPSVAPSSLQSPTKVLAEELQTLKDMHQEGLLSDEEHQLQRAKVLGETD